jgi:protease I
MTNGKLLFIIAHEGFQHKEYGETKRLIEQAGYSVVTASDGESPATGNDDSKATVDILLSKVNPHRYHGIFFIGGPGALEHLDNETSYRIAQEAAKANLPLGAICVATRILAKSGALKDRHATGWNGDNKLEAIYQQYRVIFSREPVEVDENIVTATGPDAVEEFAQKIIQIIQDHKGWG